MLSTTLGKFIMTFLISMVPIVELRGGLPYGILQGLHLPAAACAAILGNMLPVPFILLFIEHVFSFLKKNFPKMNSFIRKLEKRAEEKQVIVDKYGALGLVLLVAIPLPGTGAWTGTLAASILDMDFKKSVRAIVSGVILAGIIMGFGTKIIMLIAGLFG